MTKDKESTGIVPLRDVVSIEGRRSGVWDLLPAESLQEIVERLLDAGGVVRPAAVA